jgi:tetrahydromethanopterin S-methyltransferase subunit E
VVGTAVLATVVEAVVEAVVAAVVGAVVGATVVAAWQEVRTMLRISTRLRVSQILFCFIYSSPSRLF